jgi:hypothetical protein
LAKDTKTAKMVAKTKQQKEKKAAANAKKIAAKEAKEAKKAKEAAEKDINKEVQKKLNKTWNVLMGGYQVAKCKASDQCVYPQGMSKCEVDDYATFRQMVPVCELTLSKYKDDCQWESAVDVQGELVQGCFVDNSLRSYKSLALLVKVAHSFRLFERFFCFGFVYSQLVCNQIGATCNQ